MKHGLLVVALFLNADDVFKRTLHDALWRITGFNCHLFIP